MQKESPMNSLREEVILEDSLDIKFTNNLQSLVKGYNSKYFLLKR